MQECLNSEVVTSFVFHGWGSVFGYLVPSGAEEVKMTRQDDVTLSHHVLIGQDDVMLSHHVLTGKMISHYPTMC